MAPPKILSVMQDKQGAQAPFFIQHSSCMERVTVIELQSKDTLYHNGI